VEKSVTLAMFNYAVEQAASRVCRGVRTTYYMQAVTGCN